MFPRPCNPNFFPRRPTRGFTLIELMIVIGIIIVVMAFAVPTYHHIMGNRSISAAENLVAAMLGRARAHAISTRRYAGVAFFINPVDGRYNMALVVEKLPGGDPNEDPYLNYKSWSSTLGTRNIGRQFPPQYRVGHETLAMTVVPLPEDGAMRQRLVARRFRALQDHAGTPQTNPPDAPWQLLQNNQVYIDFLLEGETQPLPAGVGCQLINDPKDKYSPDRYVQTGAILFDAEGRLVSRDMAILRDSDIGRFLHLREDLPHGPVFRSQLGLVLFDLESFSSQQFGSLDNILNRNAPPYSGNEELEEAWLDQNAMQILVSRHTGTILRGE